MTYSIMLLVSARSEVDGDGSSGSSCEDASDRPVDVVRSTPPKTKEDLLRLMEQTSAEMAKAREMFNDYKTASNDLGKRCNNNQMAFVLRHQVPPISSADVTEDPQIKSEAAELTAESTEKAVVPDERSLSQSMDTLPMVEAAGGAETHGVETKMMNNAIMEKSMANDAATANHAVVEAQIESNAVASPSPVDSLVGGCVNREHYISNSRS